MISYWIYSTSVTGSKYINSVRTIENPWKDTCSSFAMDIISFSFEFTIVGIQTTQI